MIFCMLCLVAGCAIAVLDVDSRTGEQRVCYPANSRDEHKQPVSAVESVRDDWLSVCKKKKKKGICTTESCKTAVLRTAREMLSYIVPNN